MAGRRCRAVRSLTYYANGSAATQWAAAEVFRGVTEGDVTRYAIAKKEPLLAEHEAFRDTVLGRDAEIVTLWEGVRTVAVAEAILTSADAGRTVALTLPRQRQLGNPTRRQVA